MTNAKNDLIHVNDYDYGKIIKNFQLEEQIKKDKKRRFKDLVETNRKWRPLVNQMRETVRENEIKKIKTVLDFHNKKNKKHEMNQQKIREQKMGENSKQKKIKEEKTLAAQKRYEIKLQKDEDDRLKAEKEVIQNLENQQRNYEEQRKKQKENYQISNKRSYDNHIKNLKIRDENYENLIKQRNEKSFEKYTKTYWFRKTMLQKHNNKKNDRLRHLELINEKKEEVEKKRLADQKRFIKKLNDMERKKLEAQERKKDYIEKLRRNHEDKVLNCKETLETYKQEDDEFREDILEYQRMLITRANEKENAVKMKKNNARENIIVNQMELEKKMSQWNKDMNKIKDQSMWKLSLDKRRKLYQNILKEEAERKKKEEEDKKFKN
jgi:hypothetical protein